MPRQTEVYDYSCIAFPNHTLLPDQNRIHVFIHHVIDPCTPQMSPDAINDEPHAHYSAFRPPPLLLQVSRPCLQQFPNPISTSIHPSPSHSHPISTQPLQPLLFISSFSIHLRYPFLFISFSTHRSSPIPLHSPPPLHSHPPNTPKPHPIHSPPCP